MHSIGVCDGLTTAVHLQVMTATLRLHSHMWPPCLSLCCLLFTCSLLPPTGLRFASCYNSGVLRHPLPTQLPASCVRLPAAAAACTAAAAATARPREHSDCSREAAAAFHSVGFQGCSSSSSLNRRHSNRRVCSSCQQRRATDTAAATVEYLELGTDRTNHSRHVYSQLPRCYSSADCSR
jgi:hypothetical protein